MRKTNSKNKSVSNSLLSSLHYTYYNPSSTYNEQFNIQKRKRSKDSYVEIVKEKKDLVSYEIFQVKKYTEKNNSKTIISQRQSCPRFYTKMKNKNTENEKNVEYKLEKIEVIPYSTTLRNHSRILNSERTNNDEIKNKNHNYNRRKRNFYGCLKINDNIKEMFKTKNCDNNKDFNTFKKFDNEIEKEDGSENIYLGKISIETYSFKNNKNINSKNSLRNKKENINRSALILENKENINNNNNLFYNHKIISSYRNRIDKRKSNFEEEKNDKINTKKKSENIKKNQTFKKKKQYPENIKSSSIIMPYNKKKIKAYNGNNNNIKTRIPKQHSCQKVFVSNRYKTEITQSDSLKENINKILKRKSYINKKEKNKGHYIEINSKFVDNNDNHKDNKLKELLKKIPNNKRNKRNERNKDILGFQTFRKTNFKTFNIIEKKFKKRYKNINNKSSIMPPNNLKEIIFKKNIDFFFE